MATTKGFPVGAQWVNAFTASGLAVGTPVRIQIECYEWQLDLPL